jgi:hypothetical protein
MSSRRTGVPTLWVGPGAPSWPVGAMDLGAYAHRPRGLSLGDWRRGRWGTLQPRCQGPPEGYQPPGRRWGLSCRGQVTCDMGSDDPGCVGGPWARRGVDRSERRGSAVRERGRAAWGLSRAASGACSGPGRGRSLGSVLAAWPVRGAGWVRAGCAALGPLPRGAPHPAHPPSTQPVGGYTPPFAPFKFRARPGVAVTCPNPKTFRSLGAANHTHPGSLQWPVPSPQALAEGHGHKATLRRAALRCVERRTPTSSSQPQGWLR